MVDFNSDIGTDVFLRGLDAGERSRKAREQVGVDAAIRRGLSQATLAPPPIAETAPAPVAGQPAAAPPPPPPAAAPGPTLAPAAAGAQPPAPALAPTTAPMAAQPPQAQPQGRYDAVVQQLAGVPGGGTAALGILQQQDRQDALGARRRDQLGRLAMGALARGDTQTAQYFAQQGGLQLPPMAGTGRQTRGGGAAPGAANPRIFGAGALLAQQFYASDPAAAARFVDTFAETNGNVDQAVAAAGTPTGSVQHMKIEADRIARQFGPAATGRQAQPRIIQTPSGPQVVDPNAGTSRPVIGADGLAVPGNTRPGPTAAAAERQNAALLAAVTKRVAADPAFKYAGPAAIEAQIWKEFQSGKAMLSGNFTPSPPSPPSPPAPVAPPAPRNFWERNMPTWVGGQPEPVARPDASAATLAPLAPPAAAAAAAPQPAPRDSMVPGPRPAAPQAPPAAQRQPNTVYATPKGDLRWTGTGWLAP